MPTSFSGDSASALIARIEAARDSMTPERMAEVDAALRAEADLERRRRILAVGMPSVFEFTPFEAAPKRARDWARRCWEGDARNLALVGRSGAGKTEAACAILAATAPRMTCRFATMGDVLRAVRGTYGGGGSESAAMSRWACCRLLCLDDLGKERPTPDALDKLFALVDMRYRSGRPTVFTSQYATPADLGRRLMSQGGDAETAEAIVRRVYGMGERRAEVVTCS